MNNYINNGQNFQTSQLFFPQGNVYLLNNSLEASNIPIGTGFSVALCPSENLMYIKTLQGVMTYIFSPYESKSETPKVKSQEINYEKQIQELRKEISELAKKINGGKINELL